jgi:uncharacterized glyoxalase superfamily protein PhnB
MAKNPPEGLRNVTAQLVVRDAKALFEFLTKVFGAQLMDHMAGPDGKVMHSFLRLGDSVLFASDAGGFAKETSSNLFVYVDDVDAAFSKAKAAGAKVLAPASDMFWGDRWGMIEDPWGNVWQIAKHIEDVSPEEMKRRMPKK